MGSVDPIKIQLWDTAGQDRFQSMNKIYYRDAIAALVVYDITNKNSLLNDAEHYIRDVRDNAPGNCIIALVGNKSDLYDKQQVSLGEL